MKKLIQKMTKIRIGKEQLKLRKWALEMSLEHAQSLFPQQHRKTPTEYLSNAHKIITLVTSGWDEPIEDNLDLEYDTPIPERNP